MVIYAVYTPKVQNSWNRPRLYAFASVERLVIALRSINRPRKRSGTLSIVTLEEALKESSLAVLFTTMDKDGSPAHDGEMVFVHESAIKSTWDGSFMPIPLAEKIEEERVPRNVQYP